MDLKYLQGQRFHNRSGCPVSVLSLAHSKEMFPDVHTESPVSVLIVFVLVTEKIQVSSSLQSLQSPFQYLSTWMRYPLRLL